MRSTLRNQRLLLIVGTILVTLLLVLFPNEGKELVSIDLSEPTKIPSKHFVTEVIDGDTIKLSSGETVRYIGIDTPETVSPRTPVECYGKQASEMNKTLVLGKSVVLESDVNNTDKYGRLLRYVFLDDGSMVNEKLVRDGFANAASFPPDIKYQTIFVEAEKYARANNLGLWKECGDD